MFPPPPPVDQVELVRVDIPDLPGAVASSSVGSVFEGDPGIPGVASRPEAMAEVDLVEATGAIEALDATEWHRSGFRGQGVKIAVFDSQWRDWELLADELTPVSTHDCFDHRSCARPLDSFLEFSSSGRHGVACAEVIRDIAPDAELYLVRVTSLTSLENAVEWAVREEIDVISMSLSFFNESAYDGTGPVNRPMQKLANAGILMVTSAGNYADEHWMGTFSDIDHDSIHELEPGSEGLWVYWDPGVRRVDITWDDWDACGATDLDAYVYDEGGILVGKGTADQRPAEQREEGERCSPVERVTVNARDEGWYQVLLRRKSGDADPFIHLFARGGEVYRPVIQGSITDPGTHPAVFTVGAVRERDYLFTDVESFSSQGPTHNGIYKPDIAGPDGLTTSTYGPSGFFGTSAATPAVAAAVAVVMSEEAGRTPNEAADLLVEWAESDRATWDAHDPALGAGKARLPPIAVGSGGCGWGRILPMLVLLPGFGLRRRSPRTRKTG
jgi:subtilisin family serine protease